MVFLLMGLFDIANNIIINLFGDFEIMQKVLFYLNSEYLIVFLFLGIFNKSLRKKYRYYDIMMVILDMV